MIALVRHPALVGTVGLCYGRRDFPWAAPERDIPLILAQLRHLSAPTVYSSPSPRCARLAARLSGDICFDPRLLELDFGAWEGCAWETIPRSALDDWAADPWHFAPPGGESGAALVERVRAFAADRLAPDGVHIVISHGGPLKVLSRLLRGEAIDLMVAAPPLGSVAFITPSDRSGET
jgi:alpha-ribazole phosphatase